MKKKKIFPILAGILLIYLLCNLTYNEGNREGFIEGFLEGQDSPQKLEKNEIKCSEAGKAAYKAWKQCYEMYKRGCVNNNAEFCKIKWPCASHKKKFNNYKSECVEEMKNVNKIRNDFKNSQ